MAEVSVPVVSTADSLANEYTARELAMKLDAAESRRRVVWERLRIAADALRGIAHGDYTMDGARDAAREAIGEMKRMDR